MGGAVILPGLLDGHVHILQLGNALGRINCLSLSAEEIQKLVKKRYDEDPKAKMVLGASFLPDALGQPPHRKLLDAVVPDVPVFIDSMDLHSCWTNTKGLEVLGITKDTPSPPGGEIQRDKNGELTGLLLETAFHNFVWPWIAEQTTLEESIQQLEIAFDALVSTGVTGAIDMAMMPESLQALEEYYKRQGNRLPLRLSMHWLIRQEGTDAQREARVMEAQAHKQRLKDKAPWMRMVGIKIISDGVVDSCTAYMKEPFVNGTLPDPIWPAEDLTKVIVLADSLGLQVACHAIGDAASEQALDAFEAAVKANGDKPRRHRCEHLEVITKDSVQRLTRLGIVASLQPSHADPLYAPNWHAMLGWDYRSKRGFPWTEFVGAGSHIAFGTDTPVAPHHALPTVYTAVTRKSAVDPNLVTKDPRLIALEKYKFTLDDSIRYYTAGTAYSLCDEDETGTLEAGKSADFCVLSVDPWRDGIDTLKQAQQGVKETWIAGSKVWERK